MRKHIRQAKAYVVRSGDLRTDVCRVLEREHEECTLLSGTAVDDPLTCMDKLCIRVLHVKPAQVVAESSRS